MELPELDRAIGVTTEGQCSVSLLRDATFVVTPWVVPQQPMGQRFQLHTDIVKQMARALNLVDEDVYKEMVAERDATIEEKDATIEELKREVDSKSWAAERYFASEASKTTAARKSKNEEKIESLENIIAGLRAQLAGKEEVHA